MKKLFLFLILSSGFCVSFAQSKLVSNYGGLMCFKHSKENDESLYDIAVKYNTRPSLLLAVNNDKKSFDEGESILVPISETNYYSSFASNINRDDFEEIIYVANGNENLNDILFNFQLSEMRFEKMNPNWNNENELAQGTKLKLGWLKTNKSFDVPLYIFEEKYIFQNKMETKPEIYSYKETASSNAREIAALIRKKQNTQKVAKVNEIEEKVVTVSEKKEIAFEETSESEMPTSEVAKQSPNFTKKMNCKGAYFFAGVSTGKYYIVTNMVKKGKIVRISNPISNKQILAEVLDTMPNVDAKKGLQLKISDNAKSPLQLSDGLLDLILEY